MRPADEDTWESEYWDEYVQEFGKEAYVEARFLIPIRHAEALENMTKGGATGERNETSGDGVGLRDSTRWVWSRASDGEQRHEVPSIR